MLELADNDNDNDDNDNDDDDDYDYDDRDDDDNDDDDLVLPVVDVVVEDVQLEAVWVFVPLELRALREGGGRRRKVEEGHPEKEEESF